MLAPDFAGFVIVDRGPIDVFAACGTLAASAVVWRHRHNLGGLARQVAWRMRDFTVGFGLRLRGYRYSERYGCWMRFSGAERRLDG